MQPAQPISRCPYHGCQQPGANKFQKFCSLDHLKQYSWRKIDPEFTQTPNGIRVFFFDKNNHERNYEFSNFFPKGVVYNGETFRSAEHAFQYAKFIWNPSINHIAQRILRAETPAEAVAIARQNAKEIDPDWHRPQGQKGYTKKERIMFEIVKDKFTRNPNLKEKLLKTGNAVLVEDAPEDEFWGRGKAPNYSGQNKLGRILMAIRKAL